MFLTNSDRVCSLCSVLLSDLQINNLSIDSVSQNNTLYLAQSVYYGI